MTDDARKLATLDLGGVTVRPDSNELVIDGKIRRLKPKLMKLLVELLASQGRVVTKDDLLDSVWRNMSVSESVLTEAIHELRRALGDKASRPRFIQTIPRRGYRIVASIDRSEPDLCNGDTRPRIFVSHFSSLGADPEDSYFSEGLCEEITNSLGRIQNIDVLARTSTLEASSSETLSAHLAATHVVTGTLRRTGDRIRVIAKLSNTETGVQMWSDAFDRSLQDIVAVQNEIAEQIGAALAPQFGTAGDPKPNTRHVPDPEAFREFSKGRYFWKLDNAHPEKSMAHYEAAIQIDPAYAGPYAGMVECFNTLGVFHLMSPLSEIRDASIRYAEQALFLEPDSPDSLFAFGYTQFYMRWNWPRAEAAFYRCLAINPNHSLAHGFLSLLYSALGRHDESKAHVDAAKRIDPFSTLSWWLAFLHLHYRREFDAGLEAARRGLELHPNDVLIQWAVADSLVRLGRTHDAESAVARLHDLTVQFPLYRACAAILYAFLGKPEETRRIHDELGFDEADVDDPFICSLLSIYVGKPERALSLLEEAERMHDPILWIVACEPYFDPLRGEQQFQNLLSRLRLPADNLPMNR